MKKSLINFCQVFAKPAQSAHDSNVGGGANI